jgi:hypothetical protein
LRVHDASWRDAQNADSRTTLEQQKRIDAAFTQSLQHAFYYTQKCNMELVDVFHPHDESDVTLNIKKGLVLAFENRLRHDGETSYDEMHTDRLGEKRVQYTHHADDGALRIEALHDGERAIPVEEQSGATPQTVPLATRTLKTTTMRDGVVHKVVKEDASRFPAPAADGGAHAQRSEHDAGTFRWASSGKGIATLQQDERATATLVKRHAPNALPRHYTSFEAALAGRHRAAPLRRAAPQRVVVPLDDTDGAARPSLDVPADARPLLLGDAVGAEPGTNYRTMIAWLRREPRLAIARLQAALVELAADTENVDEPQLASARIKLLRALQQADTSETQAALLDVARYEPPTLDTEHQAMFDGDDYPRAVEWTFDDRNNAIILISLLSNPTRQTLDGLEQLMR